MPDSYGRPLWRSPRVRWDRSHAAPNVRNVNEAAANAKPMMYQIPVKRSSLPILGWLPILASGAPASGSLDLREAFTTYRRGTVGALGHSIASHSQPAP